MDRPVRCESLYTVLFRLLLQNSEITKIYVFQGMGFPRELTPSFTLEGDTQETNKQSESVYNNNNE